jgi:hypothetical protein
MACSGAARASHHDEHNKLHTHGNGTEKDEDRHQAHSKVRDPRRPAIAQAYQESESFEAWQANILSKHADRKDHTGCLCSMP